MPQGNPPGRLQVGVDDVDYFGVKGNEQPPRVKTGVTINLRHKISLTENYFTCNYMAIVLKYFYMKLFLKKPYDTM